MRAVDVTDAEQDMRQSGDDLDSWEHYIETQIETDKRVLETEKTALIRARSGQGLFKSAWRQSSRVAASLAWTTPSIWLPVTASRGVTQQMKRDWTARTDFC